MLISRSRSSSRDILKMTGSDPTKRVKHEKPKERRHRKGLQAQEEGAIRAERRQYFQHGDDGIEKKSGSESELEKTLWFSFDLAPQSEPRKKNNGACGWSGVLQCAWRLVTQTQIQNPRISLAPNDLTTLVPTGSAIFSSYLRDILSPLATARKPF